MATDEDNPPTEPALSSDPLAQPVELPEDETTERNSEPVQPKKSRRIMKLLVLLIVLAGAGFAVWKFFLSDKASPEPQQQQTQNTPVDTSQQSGSDVPPVQKLESYDNGYLRITLSHPDSWTVTEKDNGFRVESPEFTYDTLDGQVKGSFRIYVRKGAREEDGKYIGQAVAIKPSEILKYSDPAPGQRKETDLSFFGYDAPDNFAFFMVTPGFTLKKGDTLGPDYAKEAEAYVIAGGYSESDFKDDLQFNKTDVSAYSQTEAYKQALDIIKSLQIR